MKSVKKFFRFIPLLCLSVVSCLSAVLFQDHKLETTYADSELITSIRFDNTVENNYVYFDNNDYSNPIYPEQDFRFYGIVSLLRNVQSTSVVYDLTLSLNVEAINDTYGTLSLNSTYSPLMYYLPNFNYSSSPDISLIAVFNCTRKVSDYIFDFVPQVMCNSRSMVLQNGYSPSSDGNNTHANFNISSAFTGTYDTFGKVFNYSGVGFPDTAHPPRYVMEGAFELTDYQLAYDDGYLVGFNTGYDNGYNVGLDIGNSSGYENGFQAGVESQEQVIIDNYNSGYSAGFNDGYDADSTVTSIFSGVLQVGMLPVNVLLAIFNFEILGINLSAFVSAILTVCLTVIVVRTITGKKE